MHPEAMGQWIIDVIDDALGELDKAEIGAPIVARLWADGLETFGIDWPDWAKDSAYHALMAAFTANIGICREILNAMRDLVAQMGLPTVLRTEADAIANGIERTRNTIDQQFSSANLTSLTQDAWTSDAAAHYLSAYEVLGEQLEELEKSVAGLIRVLRDAAASQDAWYSSNLFNTIGTYVGVAGLAVGIAAGVVDPIAWVGLIIGVIGLLLSVIGYFLSAADSDSRAAVLSDVLSTTTMKPWTRPSFIA